MCPRYEGKPSAQLGCRRVRLCPGPGCGRGCGVVPRARCLFDRMHVGVRTSNLAYRGWRWSGLHPRRDWCLWLGRQRYSTEVQQLTRTREALRGRGRTVTCTDTRGWTCCRQMACKRSGVRISLAPPAQKRNSNRSNSEYSSKVQQRRPDGPPYVCSDRYLSLARAAGKTADFSHRSAAFRRATWANPRSPGRVTLAAWSRSGSCEQSAGL